MTSIERILNFLLEQEDDYDEAPLRDLLPADVIYRKDNPEVFARVETSPPAGAVGHFCRWAAQSYYTIYYRRATYVATYRKRGKGTYWRQVSSGYGPYPYFGSKGISASDDSIEFPD